MPMMAGNTTCKLESDLAVEFCVVRSMILYQLKLEAILPTGVEAVLDDTLQGVDCFNYTVLEYRRRAKCRRGTMLRPALP